MPYTRGRSFQIPFQPPDFAYFRFIGSGFTVLG